LNEEDGDRDPQGADDEEPAPREVVDDQSGEDDPEPAADPEYRRDQTDRDTDLLARKLVADDPVAEREDGRAGALKGTPGDQRPDVPGGSRADRADQEQRQRDDEQPLFPVLVAELAEDRSRNGRHEQEDREHPGDPSRRGVELTLQRRQSRDDHGLLQRERDPGQREDRERHVVVLALDFHWALRA
jgi:hypothetical protein